MLTIYKASAGSGKTYTLAYEYVKLLLGVKQPDGSYRLDSAGRGKSSAQPRCRHRHILAITFTNKATAEMKSRIIAELTALASDAATPAYAPDLMACFGCTRGQLREASGAALRSLLFDYHHFNVSTIDSFFQTVLRSFAREVDRQGDYGLELNDEFAVTSGIGLMLDDLNYGTPHHRGRMMRWISDYTVTQVEKGKDGSMFNRSGALIKDLSAYVRKMGSEVFKAHADEVLAYLDGQDNISAFIRHIDTRIKRLAEPLADRVKQLMAEFDSLGIAPEAIPSPARKIIATVSEGSAVSPGEPFDKVSIRQMLDWCDDPEPPFYVKSKLTGKPKIYPPLAFTRGLSQWMSDCRRAMAEIHGLKKIAAACPNLEFLGFAWHYINRFREENNLILLSDTNDLLQRIIGKSDTPFIYERIGVTLRHFLIDEFQDTSHMQWHNLRPLVADSLASDNDNLIIGDEKQAIYRFRNSDSSLLNHTVADRDFPDNHVIRGNCAQENTNHRSAHGIVRFNNTLFTSLARQCGVQGYDNTVQSLSSRKSGLDSFIQIHDTSALPPVNDCPAELDLTAQKILAQHEAGYSWRDIAVLVRRRKEAEAVVNYLLNHYPQISVISDEALLLRNSPAVRLIVSMLKLIDKSYSNRFDCDDSTVATHDYGSMGDIRLMISRYEYFISEGIAPDDALGLALQSGDTSAISDSIADIRAAHPSGLVALTETIIAKKISPAQRLREFAYIAAFQDEVIKYCTLYNPSIHAFLQWWDEASAKLAVNAADEQDAVSVMTVHKSKGLQWPCVHIPFGDWELVRPSDSVWVKASDIGFDGDNLCPPVISVDIDKDCVHDGSPLRDAALRNRSEQLVDNLNATYVAYTRPERELHICFSHKKAVGSEVIKALSCPVADDGLLVNLSDYIVTDDGADAKNGLIFTYGAPTSPDSAAYTGNAADHFEIDDYCVNFRADTAALTSIDDATSDIDNIDTAPDSTAAVADIDNDAAAGDSRRQAALHGIWLHSVLADIRSIGDIDDAIKRASSRHALDEDGRSSCAALLHKAFADGGDIVARWFDPEATVYCEQGIYNPADDLNFRPDRIVICPDGSVDVIDYKFTSEPLDAHRHQVEGYVSLLRSMGHTQVTGYLWYPALNIIIRVTQSQLPI